MIKNERGITLVELLGSLALMSIILLLIGSVHLFGQRQFRDQSADINSQSQVRYVMSQVTSDIRSITSDQVTGDTEGVLNLGVNVYEHNNSSAILSRNGVVISENIKTFTWAINDEEVDVHIELTVGSTDNQRGQATELVTTIYFRR